MATRFDSWEAYFYPPPDHQTLRNLFDERDPFILARLEYAETGRRERELRLGEVVVPQTYDAAHLRAIHRHLFQDVYEWAGEYRTVDMSKGQHTFASVHVHPSEVEFALGRASEVVRSTDWQRADRAQFAQGMAEVYAWTNAAHSFRDGNGRTAKMFLAQIAEQSHFDLDLGNVDPRAWNLMSAATMPRQGEGKIRPAVMADWFKDLIVERPERPRVTPVSATPQSAERLAAARKQFEQRRHGRPDVAGESHGTDSPRRRGPQL